MEQHPIQNDARRAARERLLGEERSCVMCGESDFATLRRARLSLLEEHHVVGKANDADATVTLCFNCHRKLTERMRANGTCMDRAQTLPDRLIAVLLGLAAFFQMLSEMLTEWATRERRLATALDRDHPKWREMREAQ